MEKEIDWDLIKTIKLARTFPQTIINKAPYWTKYYFMLLILLHG